MLEAEDLMHAQKFRNLVGKKASHGGNANSKASKEAEVGAGGSHSGSEKTRGILEGEKKLLIPGPNGELDQDPHLGDGEAEGGQGEDGSSVGEAHEVGQRDGVRVQRRRVGEVGVRRRGAIKK